MSKSEPPKQETDEAEFTLGVRELLVEQEVRRVFNQLQAATSAMEEKDEVWMLEWWPEFDRAVQVCVAARDCDVPMPGGDAA